MRSTLWLRVVVGGAMRCALTNMLHLHSMSQIASAQIFGTEGLISTDRGTEPTLMLTIPRSIQSRLQRIYLSQHLKLCLSVHTRTASGPGGRRNLMMWDPRAYRYSRYIGRGEASSLSSMDSDLEAFSHNPTDGSFGALAVQPTP